MRTRLARKSGRRCIGLLIAAMFLPALRTKSDEPAKAEKPAADSMIGKEAGDVREDNGLKMKFVWCPPGEFEMGDEEGTKVKVFLTHGYWLGKYEATQSEWKQVMETEPWKLSTLHEVKEGDDFPTTCASWNDVMEFCGRLTKRERDAGRLHEGWEYTLPTEAQWERACRARTETRYSFGDDESKLGEYAWFDKSSGGDQFAHRIGLKKANPWGLHDMHGNVREFCRDAYTRVLPGGRDPETKAGPERVARGGSFAAPSRFSRSAGSRARGPRDSWSAGTGFRVALVPVQPAR